MAKYIYNIIKSQKVIMWSWGFHSPIAVENGLRFKVNGFKHKGTVEILYIEGKDLFKVNLIKGQKTIKTVDDVYLDSLVNVIDGLVERTENYMTDVQNWASTMQI